MNIQTLVALLASLLLGACTAVPLPEVISPSADAADPATRVRPASYTPVLSGYQHRQPAGPENWRKLNDRLSPANREPSQ